MFPHLALAAIFFYLRAAARPDPQVLQAQIGHANVTVLDMHMAMRRMLPVISFGVAGNVALLMAILHGFGLVTENADGALTLVLMVAGLGAGVLVRTAVRTAELLVQAEGGTPSEKHREKLMHDLVLFPLLPVAVTLIF